MGYNEPTFQSCEAVTGATAETVELNIKSYLRIDNDIGDTVYIRLNWAAGDTEVSATNFAVAIRPYESFEFKHEHPTSPALFNMRVICATSGRLGLLGW